MDSLEKKGQVPGRLALASHVRSTKVEGNPSEATVCEEVQSPEVASFQEMGSLFPRVTLEGGVGNELARDPQTKLLQGFITSQA